MHAVLFYLTYMKRELEMQIPSDKTKINTNNLGELIWWCAHLGIGPEKLVSIIEKVGNSFEKVVSYLHSAR